jgi:tetratricopeptide (TPR) repeat protein
MASLAQRLLSEEILDASTRRRTGILEVTSGDVAKGVFFRGGQIIFATSTQEADRLGENLIRIGRISRAEFASAYRDVTTRKRRIGQTLVKAGVVGEDEIGRLVARQVETIVLSLFMWTAGEMQFIEAAEPIPEDLALDLSTHRLVLEGIRVYPDPDRLERALGGVDRRIRPATRPPFDASRAPLSIAERNVLEEAAGGVAIADILAGPTPRPLLVRATYALLASGLLEDAAAPAPKVEVVEEDTGTFRMAMASARVPRHAAAREEIRRLYEALPRSTHYDVLTVSPDATEADVAAAYSRLQGEHEARWAALEKDPELGTAVFTLKLRRREAYEVLSDPRRRDSYDRSLAGVNTPGVGIPAAARPEAPPNASGLHKQAEALLEKHEADRALPLLMKAVEVDPKFRPARRLLAILLAQDPNLAASAERHFLAALEQEADDVDLRYRLARYYKKLGLNARAILQLRIVLGKDPEHVAAWNDLRELEKETRSGRT